MSLTRGLLAPLLIVVLAMTGLAAGMARGQATPVGSMEICRGLTVVEVAVDAEGRAIGHVHLCDDGMMALFASVGLAVAQGGMSFIWQAVESDPQATALADAERPSATARGPPLFL
ncbi:hypothetical protein [Sagittula stellata]|nr:hypothetical protein [Sagittula stellata]